MSHFFISSPDIGKIKREPFEYALSIMESVGKRMEDFEKHISQITDKEIRFFFFHHCSDFCALVIPILMIVNPSIHDKLANVILREKEKEYNIGISYVHSSGSFVLISSEDFMSFIFRKNETVFIAYYSNVEGLAEHDFRILLDVSSKLLSIPQKDV